MLISSATIMITPDQRAAFNIVVVATGMSTTDATDLIRRLAQGTVTGQMEINVLPGPEATKLYAIFPGKKALVCVMMDRVYVMDFEL
jgi:hypothetical protein